VIEQVVAGGRYVKEGLVQAAIGRFAAAGFTLLDREAVVSFGSRAEKGCLHRRTLGPLARRAAPDGPASMVEDKAGPAR
jgi:hypothetical protein